MHVSSMINSFSLFIFVVTDLSQRFPLVTVHHRSWRHIQQSTWKAMRHRVFSFVTSFHRAERATKHLERQNKQEFLTIFCNSLRTGLVEVYYSYLNDSRLKYWSKFFLLFTLRKSLNISIDLKFIMTVFVNVSVCNFFYFYHFFNQWSQSGIEKSRKKYYCIR